MNGARCTAMILALSACSLPENGPELAGMDPIIVGAVDWIETTALAEGSWERVNSLSVGYVSLPAVSSRCTGFLIAPNILMTNSHCVASASEAAGAHVYFRRELGSADWAEVSCGEFIGNNAALDYALLRCTDAARFGSVELATRSAARNEAVYLIHQNCDWYTDETCAPDKKYSPGHVRSVWSEIAHDADTLGGSSGGPLFAASSHAVIGLHHTGSTGTNGRGTENYAVQMSSIVPDVRRRFPNIALGRTAPEPDAPPPPPEADYLEVNDDRSSATPASFVYYSDLSIHSATDRDVFRIEVTGHLEVSATFRHANGDVDLELQATDTASTTVARSTSSDDDESLSEDLAPGTYYLTVYGWNGAINTYDLSIEAQP